MKKTLNLLFLLLFLLPAAVSADDNDNDQKYLEGAVPVEDGKVTFSTRLEAPLSKAEIYNTVLNFCEKHFVKNEKYPQCFIPLAKETEGEIVASGDEYIVFSSGALSLDRSRIYYQLHALCSDGACDLTMSRIRYLYDENRDGGQKYKAEDWITDENALSKKKDKLSKITGKFRRKTIDLKDELFDGIEAALAGNLMKPKNQPTEKAKPVENKAVRVITAPVAQETLVTKVETKAKPETKSEAKPEAKLETKPQVIAATPLAPATQIKAETEITSLQGYKEITIEQMPSGIMNLLNQNQMRITVGTKDKFSCVSSNSGSIGRLFDKPVFTCFVNPAQPIYLMMEKADTYTLTFFANNSGKQTPTATPTGNVAYKEANLVIECKKILSQSLNPDALKTDELSNRWVGKVMDKMYIGEILHIWTK